VKRSGKTSGKTGGKPAASRRRKTPARPPRAVAKRRPQRARGDAALRGQLDRKTRELNEALEQQAASSEVLRIISSSPGELEPVFQAILENATRICQAQFGTLNLYDGSAYRTVALHNPPPQFAFRLGVVMHPHPESGLAHVARTTQIAHIEDIRTHRPYLDGNKAVVDLADLAGARTLLIVPMLNAGKLVGAISIYRQEIRPFTGKQIELLSNFAAQAVIAIENARLLNELRESLEQQTATAGVLSVINVSRGDLQPVFEAMVEKARRLCEADAGHLALPVGGDYRSVAVSAMSPEMAVVIRSVSYAPGRGTAVGRALEERRPVQISDIGADNEHAARHAADKGFIRTILGVPLLREDEAIGAFGLSRQRVEPFSERQIELVRTFADQAVIAIENTRLLNELRQRTTDLMESLEQQTATADVLRVISSSPGELDPVFQAMLENATRICEAQFGTLFLAEGDAFRAVAMRNAPPAYAEFEKQRGLFQTMPGSPLNQILRTKDVVHRVDDSAEPVPGAAGKLGDARTLLVVPMLKEDALIGAFSIYRQEVRPFTDKQIALVQNFAAQAVIAIENTRLLNELRQRTADLTESLEQQTATADVLRVISSSPGELEPVFNAMLENAVRLCQAEFGNMFLYDGEAFHAAALHRATQAYVEVRRRAMPVRDTHPDVPIIRLLGTKQVIHIADVRTEKSYIERDQVMIALVEGAGARTLLLVPMLKDNDLVGALAIYRKEVRLFADKQIALLTSFAAQAVIAIENTRLLNELRQSLQQQTATADVLKIISRSAFNLQSVLDTLVQSAARLCEADMASMNRHFGDAYRQVASYGFSPEAEEFMAAHPVGLGRGTTVGRTIHEKKPVQIPDVLADPDFKFAEGAKIAGVRTAAAVPMLKQNDLIGVIAVYRRDVRPFTDKQIELVTTFADQAVIAIENARLFEAEQQRTRELSASLEDLRTAQDRLVQTEKLASLGQLTAGIAHEIKNPLNFVNNFSSLSVELIDELQEELAKVKIDDAARGEIADLANTLKGNLDKIAQHGKRADSIVKNMLLHSRAGSGERRPVDVNALVEESLNLAYHGARAEKQGFNIALERAFDPAAGEADLYPQEVTRVLLNLIANGFYAATKRKAETDGEFEPSLAAATRSLGDRVEIRIRDNGAGIPPEVKEKMFNPFFTTKPAGEGTGLGLSISHDIVVKQHAGTITVDTEPGKFTEFRIVLPRSGASPKAGGRA